MIKLFNYNCKHPKARLYDSHRSISKFKFMELLFSEWEFWLVLFSSTLLFYFNIIHNTTTESFEKWLIFLFEIGIISSVFITILSNKISKKMIFIKHGVFARCTLHSISEVIEYQNDYEGSYSKSKYYLNISFLINNEELIKAQVEIQRGENYYKANKQYDIVYLPWKPTQVSFVKMKQ